MFYGDFYELKERLKENVSSFEIVYPDPYMQGLHHVFRAVPVVSDSQDPAYMILKYNRNRNKPSAEGISSMENAVICDLDVLMKHIQEYIKDIKEYKYEMNITSAGITDQVQLKDPMDPFYAFANYLKKFKWEHYPNFHIEIHKEETDHWITEKMKFYFIDGPDQMYISVRFVEGGDKCFYVARYYKDIPQILRSIDPYLRGNMRNPETSHIDIFCDSVDSTDKCVIFPIYYRP